MLSIISFHSIFQYSIEREAVKMSPLPNHLRSAAAFVVCLLLCIAKRLEHLTAVAILNVRSGNLNTAAVVDLCDPDLAAIFFHSFSPPFFPDSFLYKRYLRASM